MNQEPARIAHPPRGQRLLGAALLAALFVSLPVQAEEASAVEPPPATTATALPAAPPLPPPANPALDVAGPAAEEPRPSVFRRWWFWTAVGAAAAVTVVVIVASSRGDAPPATDLGNQEFRP